MTNKIAKALSLGKVKGAKALLTEYYNNEHKQEFTTAKLAEYEALFPTYRDMTEEEKAEYDVQFTEENPRPVTMDDEGNELPYEYPQVAIEYIGSEEVTETVTPEEGEPYEVTKTVEVRTPAEYLTYSEWMAETEVTGQEEISKEVFNEETEEFETITESVDIVEQVRPYVGIDVSDKVEAYLGSQYAKVRQYPSIEEQMDMQYWDVINGTTVWQDMITAEKLRVPKEPALAE